jgi:hypothetical protein
MSLSRRLSRLESRLDAQRQVAATPGSCRCPNRKHVVVWPEEFEATIDRTPPIDPNKPCAKCGGMPLVLKVELDS